MMCKPKFNGNVLDASGVSRFWCARWRVYLACVYALNTRTFESEKVFMARMWWHPRLLAVWGFCGCGFVSALMMRWCSGSAGCGAGGDALAFCRNGWRNMTCYMSLCVFEFLHAEWRHRGTRIQGITNFHATPVWTTNEYAHHIAPLIQQNTRWIKISYIHRTYLLSLYSDTNGYLKFSTSWGEYGLAWTQVKSDVVQFCLRSVLVKVRKSSVEFCIFIPKKSRHARSLWSLLALSIFFAVVMTTLEQCSV